MKEFHVGPFIGIRVLVGELDPQNMKVEITSGTETIAIFGTSRALSHLGRTLREFAEINATGELPPLRRPERN